jgi:hypothetical protein
LLTACYLESIAAMINAIRLQLTIHKHTRDHHTEGCIYSVDWMWCEPHEESSDLD